MDFFLKSVRLSLKSTQLKPDQLHSLAKTLGLPVSGSTGDLRLIIEGEITNLSHEPCSIQVALSRGKDDKRFTLSDHEGVFLTVNQESVEPEGQDEQQ